MTVDLLRRVQQGVGIVLEGTSFNHPEFNAKQNYVAGYSILLSALGSEFAISTKNKDDSD